MPRLNLCQSARSVDHLPRGQRPRPGFTLLELVVVMVLLTIVLAMAVPSLRGFAAGSRARDAASQLVSMAQWAKARAAADSRVYRLNSDGGSYWFTMQEGEDYIPTGTDMGRVFTLPPNLSVRLGSVGGEAIDFHPDGRTDTARLLLTDDQSGAVTVIASPSPAEPFRILSEEEARR